MQHMMNVWSNINPIGNHALSSTYPSANAFYLI